MRVEGLLAANLCLVTILSSEQCTQFERFRLELVQMVNKTSKFKTKFIGNNAKGGGAELTTFMFHLPTF